MLLKIENSGEQDQECSQEWLVNTDPGIHPTAQNATAQIWLVFHEIYKNKATSIKVLFVSRKRVHSNLHGMFMDVYLN